MLWEFKRNSSLIDISIYFVIIYNWPIVPDDFVTRTLSETAFPQSLSIPFPHDRDLGPWPSFDLLRTGSQDDSVS